VICKDSSDVAFKRLSKPVWHGGAGGTSPATCWVVRSLGAPRTSFTRLTGNLYISFKTSTKFTVPEVGNYSL
jgi:hypothetical protein